jgi:hypothetical protein
MDRHPVSNNELWELFLEAWREVHENGVQEGLSPNELGRKKAELVAAFEEGERRLGIYWIPVGSFAVEEANESGSVEFTLRTNERSRHG